jgi:small subunit ribosomal protein S8
MTDPISDMLTRIRNAQAVRHQTVTVPFSNLKVKITQILLREGFIKDFKRVRIRNQKLIKIYLKYDSTGTAKILGLKKISKPGQRIYKKAKEIKKVRGGFGIAVVSSSKGIITDKEARKQKLGGEVLAEIW